MTFKLAISALVLFTVKGTVLDEQGVERAFDFKLRAERSTAEEIGQVGKSGEPVTDFLLTKIKGWHGVTADDGKTEIPFTEEGCRELLSIAGMGTLVYLAYLEATGAKGKEKN